MDVTTNTLNDEQIVALVQYCGLPGYKAGDGTANPDLDRKLDRDELAIHEMIRESGLPGYNAAKLATQPRPNVSSRALVTSTEPSRTDGGDGSMASNGSISKRQFLVLDIAPDGATALAELEAKMGVGIAVERQGTPSWVTATTQAGGSRRAFSFMAGQLVGFVDLLGELGTPALRLSVTGIELNQFKSVGPGVRDGEPPQWPDSLNGVLRSALGKVR